MVLPKLQSSAEQRQALVAVTLTTSSPRVSLGNSHDDSFQVVLKLRIISSAQSGRAITISTSGSAFEHFDDIDALARPAFSDLVNVDNRDKKISLGRFFTHPASKENDLDLRNMGFDFITIPGDGSEVCIAHDLSLDRMYKYAEGVKKEDLKPGERYRLKVADGYIGTTWWCWGDLNTDLRDSKMCAWSHGFNWSGLPRPSDRDIEEEKWVLGEDCGTLWWDEPSATNRTTEFQFTE